MTFLNGSVVHEIVSRGCALPCPCRAPRTFRGDWIVFSTGVRMRLEQTSTDGGAARVFEWVQA